MYIVHETRHIIIRYN